MKISSKQTIWEYSQKPKGVEYVELTRFQKNAFLQVRELQFQFYGWNPHQRYFLLCPQTSTNTTYCMLTKILIFMKIFWHHINIFIDTREPKDLPKFRKTLWLIDAMVKVRHSTPESLGERIRIYYDRIPVFQLPLEC